MDLKNMELYELYFLLLTDFIHQDRGIVEIDIDYLFEVVNERYKEENGVYLSTKSELYKWLSDKCRYTLLDELLVRLYNRFINIEKLNDLEIDNTDLFFVNNIHEMERIIDKEEKIIYNTDVVKYDNKTEIDKYKVIEIVKDILLELDDNGEWLEIYNKILNENKIIYLNELSNKEVEELKDKFGIQENLYEVKNACTVINDSDIYILLTYKGNLDDICVTIHEVIHYIVRYYNNNKKEKIIFRELPSIFYELYCLDYLKKMGYNEDELNEFKINIRLIDTCECIYEIDILINYLKTIIDKGNITREDVMDEYKLTMERAYGNDNYYEIPTECDSRCDNCIYDLIKNPYSLFYIYPYIIDTYLASMAINKINTDKYILSFMKYITEHINNVSEEDVFNIILDGKLDLYEDNKIKKKDIKN